MSDRYKVTFFFKTLDDARFMDHFGRLAQSGNMDAAESLAKSARDARAVKLSTPSKKGGRR